MSNRRAAALVVGYVVAFSSFAACSENTNSADVGASSAAQAFVGSWTYGADAIVDFNCPNNPVPNSVSDLDGSAFGDQSVPDAAGSVRPVADASPNGVRMPATGTVTFVVAEGGKLTLTTSADSCAYTFVVDGLRATPDGTQGCDHATGGAIGNLYVEYEPSTSFELSADKTAVVEHSKARAANVCTITRDGRLARKG